ncbi:MAG: outer membrane lipoprotein chaperone LolA [Burkholderiaceae bacterium]|jgi:outer membrane lipoprotein carrier protein|nr:outer membrane lipoprotein chaperone LolA [Burkholderiaceae bacterium]
MTRRLLAAALLALASTAATAADAVDALRAFVRDVSSGRAEFTQTVTSPDGRRTRTSSGRFEFARPDRFRFEYVKPFAQTIVGDGRQVWIYDPGLQQASVRPMSQALGATPAALLTGTSLERDFELSALPARDGLDWVQARPKQAEGSFSLLRVGFAGAQLAALEIVDNFGQTSVLRFERVEQGAALPPETFRFTPPPGVELLTQ